MKRAILAAVLFMLSAATGARAQWITVFSHTTILGNGEALAECGTVLGDPATISNYLAVGADCEIYRGTTLIQEFSCAQGKPSSQCQKIFTTMPGEVYKTRTWHLLDLYYASPCLQLAPWGYYDPYFFGVPRTSPLPTFTESGDRRGDIHRPMCWQYNEYGQPVSGDDLIIALSESNPASMMSVSPSQATLYDAQTQQLTSNMPATWSIVQGEGTVDGNGLYRAPGSVTSEQTVIVQACDVANGVNCAKATITLKKAAVNVTPVGQEMLPATQKTFQAAIIPGSFSQAVQWSRTPALGSIDATTGVYTAPANTELPGPVEITIKACSKDRPTLCGTATVVVPKVDIVVAGPSGFLVTPGSTLSLQANAAGPVTAPEVTWVPSAGTVAPLGFNSITYTPPAVTAAQNVTFRVCLKLSPSTCGTPDYSLTLVPPATITSAGTWFAGTAAVAVTITGTGFGTAPEVRLSDTSIPFTVVSKSDTSIVIKPSVNVSAGGRTLGVTVQSTTAGVTASDTRNVTVTKASLTISPASASLQESQTQSFSTACTANGSPCTVVNPVAWSASMGTVSVTGATTARYMAPASVAGTTSVPVKACWATLPTEQCATATATINPILVDVTPAAVNVNGCSTQRFNVAVSNTSSTGVTWSINPAVGAIDSTGLYTAPCPVTAQTQVQVKACSTANNQKCDTSQVTLIPVTVSISPQTANVTPGGTQQFSAVVQGSTNTIVAWSMSPTGSAAGSLDGNGLYRAPATITTVTTVTVTATSLADSTTKATAQVNLVVPSARLTPTSLTFTDQDLGTTSAAQTVTLSNQGTAPFLLSGITISGDFNQTHNCGSALAPGASCAIQVKFLPTAVGSRTGTLTVSSTAPGSPHSASLSGTGRGPVAALSPASVDFGGHRPGFPSPARTVTLSNTGTGPMAISSITVDGEFTQTNNCGTSLAAGTSCSINVRFNPAASSSGQRWGTLRVTNNAAGSPHGIGLTGSAYGGFHDSTTCTGSSGRAWDPARPYVAVYVYVFDGNTLLAQVPASKYRADLESAGYSNGYHAFEWTMPASLRDGQPHDITIRYSPDPNAVPIPGSPKTITCSATPSHAGYHESATCQGLSGWGWDATQPNTSITLYIFEGTVSRGSVVAGQYRQDLFNAGIGDGRHAFNWAIPSSLMDGQPHSLTVRFGSSASSPALTGSPKTITCAPAPAPTANIEWIHPAEESWGPAGTLTTAGFARNGSGNVQLVWRERSSSGVWGPWTTVAYTAPVLSDGSWSNTISSGNPTDKCHWFEAKVSYSGITSATYLYTGASGCP